MVGSEINSNRVTIAKQISKNIKNISFEVNNLLPKNQKFDTIIAIDLLHHISSAEKTTFINDCWKYLRPDGLLIIKDIDTKPFLKFIWTYIHDLIFTKFEPLDFYSSTKMSFFLKCHKFRIIEKQMLKNILYPHVIYVCQKEK
jgi:2-polyprenyl-3-methyl-5-hydroxy-6-metoxy-1,4-benzoquinol methylase